MRAFRAPRPGVLRPGSPPMRRSTRRQGARARQRQTSGSISAIGSWHSTGTAPDPGRIGRRAARRATMSADPLVLHVIAGLGVGGAERMLAALVTAKRAEPHGQAVVDLLARGALAP